METDGATSSQIDLDRVEVRFASFGGYLVGYDSFCFPNSSPFPLPAQCLIHHRLRFLNPITLPESDYAS